MPIQESMCSVVVRRRERMQLLEPQLGQYMGPVSRMVAQLVWPTVGQHVSATNLNRRAATKNLQIFADGFQTSFDVLDGSGEGEAQVAFAMRSEDDAGNCGDSALHQEFLRGDAAIGVE